MNAPYLGRLPDGSRGIDCNTRIARPIADKLYAAGYRFVVRYIRRGQAQAHDVSVGEVLDLLAAGLGLMLVQHVAMEGWVPSQALGKSYGAIAANEAALLGYPIGGMVWLDLEGVRHGVAHEDVIKYCNAWYDAVAIEGYLPGIYIGDSSGLTADEMYRRLKFTHYWSAYNLNRDEHPAVRGVMMRQLPYPPQSKRVHGVPFEYDEDVITVDKKGDTPTVLLPGAVP
jgi:hypothetical protein